MYPSGTPLNGKNTDFWHKNNLTCTSFQSIFYSVTNKTIRLYFIFPVSKTLWVRVLWSLTISSMITSAGPCGNCKLTLILTRIFPPKRQFCHIDICVSNRRMYISGGSRGGHPPFLFWVKKEEIIEGRKAGRASKTKPPLPPPPLPLSSRSGSATVHIHDCQNKNQFHAMQLNLFRSI